MMVLIWVNKMKRLWVILTLLFFPVFGQKVPDKDEWLDLYNEYVKITGEEIILQVGES